jgi:nitrate reductase cytochrome c-type subunit
MTVRSYPKPASALVVVLLTGELGPIAWSQQGTGRSELRAFYTAPPVIPHELVDERDTGTCLVCHQSVVELEERVSVRTPHPEFTNCLQCHLRSVTPGWMTPKPSVETAWQGLEEPTTGGRAHALAPPTIPHRLFLRDRCRVCHGLDHPNEAMRTPHPERWSCRQCHLAGAPEF